MAKPFLKWAGGKKWFVNQERDRLLLDFNRYIEPFLGGGSVFFYINPQQAILSDINAELVNAYICLRDEFESVYKKLHIHQIHNSEEYYYIIRDRQTRTNATSAARTIYLNKACFNGVYRVNRDGKFNVPYGKVKTHKVHILRLLSGKIPLPAHSLSLHYSYIHRIFHACHGRRIYLS